MTRARVAVRRRLERRAAADPRGRRAGRSSPGSSGRLPADLDARRPRLLRAFRQRYDRLVEVAPRLSLERLCERIVAEHDYDLAVLAQWDGRRRYANLRKLARLARSYEELRGPDVEGFVRFVAEQEAVGAAEREAVAEEEGADAVRLLTIHAAKGLEFKVVVVADAGRDRTRLAPTRSSASPTAASASGSPTRRRAGAHGVLGYDSVKEASGAGGRGRAPAPLLRRDDAGDRPADRVGSIDPSGRRTSGRRSAGCSAGSTAPRSSPRGDGAGRARARGARVLVRLDRLAAGRGAPPGARAAVVDEEPASWRSSPRARADAAAARAGARADPGAAGAAAARRPAPLVQRARALRALLLPLLRRARRRHAGGAGARHRAGRSGLAATEIGDAVHRLLELVDLSAPGGARQSSQVRSLVPGGDGRGAGADRRVRRGLLRLGARAADRGARGRPPRAAVRVRARRRAPARPPRRPPRRGAAALVLDYKTNSLAEGAPEEIVEADYRLQRLVYALACLRAGADEVEVVYHFLERPDAVVSTTFARADVPALEAELSEAIGRIRAGEFGRRRASSPAPAALRSTSSAPGRASRRPEPATGARGSRVRCASRRSTTCTATCPRSRRCSPRCGRSTSTGSSAAATSSRARSAGRVPRPAPRASRRSSCAGTPTGSRRERGRDEGVAGRPSSRARRTSSCGRCRSPSRSTASSSATARRATTRRSSPGLARRAISRRARRRRGAGRRRRAHARPVRARRRRDPLRQRRQRRDAVRGPPGAFWALLGEGDVEFRSHGVRGRGGAAAIRTRAIRMRSRWSAGCSSRRIPTRCPSYFESVAT